MTKPVNRDLVRFHARGQRIDQQIARRRGRGEGVWGALESLDAETAAQKHRLQEARKFARLCDENELAFLCGLGQPTEWKLTPTHILQLIRVKARTQRMQLARTCARKCWSTRELQREVDRMGLHRSYGGRKQKPPESVEEALLVTQRLAATWLRWGQVLAPCQTRTSPQRISLGRLPTSTRTRVKQMLENSELLDGDIARYLDRQQSRRS